MVNAALFGPNPRFAPQKRAPRTFGYAATAGYPPPPRSMKTMELHRRKHAALRVVGSYRQNLEPQRLTTMWLRAGPPALETRGRKWARSLRSRGKRRIRPHTRDLRPRTPSRQNRQLELATFNQMQDEEIADPESALRGLWVIEEKRRNR